MLRTRIEEDAGSPPPFVTQNRLNKTVEAFRRDGNTDRGDVDVVTEELSTLGSRMFMSLALEMKARQATLQEAIQDAGRSGMLLECLAKFLWHGIEISFGRFSEGFGRKAVGRCGVKTV